MANVVFHIGYPKTGTTTLQKSFFDDRRVYYLGKMLRGGKHAADSRTEPSIRLVMDLLSADTTRFEQSLPELQGLIAAPVATGLPVVLSDEAFTFAEYMRLPAISATPVFTDHAVLAGRFRQLWPEATIIVSIREQKSFITSFYLQSLKTGMNFQSFPEYVEAAFATSDRRSVLNALRYDEMYRAYAGAFGPERVKLLPFETYRKDFSLLLATVANAAGIDVGETLARWGGRHDNARKDGYPHARWVHEQLSRSGWRPSERTYLRLSRIWSLVPDSVEMPPEIAGRLDAFFGPSNRALNAATGLDLETLGYA